MEKAEQKPEKVNNTVMFVVISRYAYRAHILRVFCVRMAILNHQRKRQRTHTQHTIKRFFFLFVGYPVFGGTIDTFAPHHWKLCDFSTYFEELWQLKHQNSHINQKNCHHNNNATSSKRNVHLCFFLLSFCFFGHDPKFCGSSLLTGT